MITADWRNNLDHWPVPFAGVPLEAQKAALIIIDMQRYWTDRRGPIGQLLGQRYPDMFEYFYGRLTRVVIPSLAIALNGFRDHGLPVVHITTGALRADGKDLSPHLQRRRARAAGTSGEFHLLQNGSDWYDVAPELAPKPGEIVLHKTSRSAFNSTGIEQVLRNMGVAHVVVGGLASNACVELTASDAADRGFETFLVEDGCATFVADAHSAAMKNFHRVFGTVLTVDELRARMP